MATVARSRLRAMLGIALGNEPRFYFSGSLTTIGAAGGATLIDTKIARFDSSRIVNKWILLTSGSISGEAQRVSTVSNDAVGTITPVRVFSAQVASGVTYEILPFDPADMHNALQYAGRIINSYNPLFLRNETLIVDNLVLNPLFATFAGGAFTSWTSIGGPTISQNTSYFWHGSQSANIAPAAANEGLEQNLLTVAQGFGRIDQAVGKTLHVRAALRATNTGNARVRVTFDGTTYTEAPGYHSGDDDWEGPGVHTIDVAIPASPSEMTVSVEAATTTAFQAGMVVAWIDPINRYTLPTSFIYPSPHRVLMQADQAKPNGDYLPLRYGNVPVAGRILRLEGLGRLTVPTTDAGTVELDETRSELLIALAAAFLLRNDPANAIEERMWLQQAEGLKRALGVGRKYMGANKREGWSVLDDSGTSYLLLEDR